MKSRPARCFARERPKARYLRFRDDLRNAAGNGHVMANDRRAQRQQSGQAKQNWTLARHEGADSARLPSLCAARVRAAAVLLRRVRRVGVRRRLFSGAARGCAAHRRYEVGCADVRRQQRAAPPS